MIDSNDAPFGLDSDQLGFVTVGAEWASRFDAERRKLSAALGAAAGDVQHIGSTAVPGILAKPILDIAVAIDSFEAGHPLVPLLVGLGYVYRGENGIPRRHYFVQGSPRRTHHLHVLEAGSADLARHLRFRDALLASPSTAARYSALKRALAEEAGGRRDVYQGRKSSFIAEVLAQGPAPGGEPPSFGHANSGPVCPH